MDEFASALAEGIETALPLWVERSVDRLVGAYLGDTDRAAAEATRTAARRAGAEAVADVVPRVRALLDADVDEQRTNPLSLLREAVRYPTAVLRIHGVPPVERDAFAEDRFPDDVYDLTPASFAEIDPDLAGPGLAWGAAKAWAHRQRHQAGGAP